MLSKTDGREKERWVFSPDVILDSNGIKLTGSKNDMYWYRSLLEKNALPIKPSSSIPARCGREVYAGFVKMSNKHNFFTFNLCLAGGSVLLHSRLVRKSNGGQGPLHVYFNDFVAVMHVGRTTLTRASTGVYWKLQTESGLET